MQPPEKRGIEPRWVPKNKVDENNEYVAGIEPSVSYRQYKKAETGR